jgi:hypothetical protein
MYYQYDMIRQHDPEFPRFFGTFPGRNAWIKAQYLPKAHALFPGYPARKKPLATALSSGELLLRNIRKREKRT